MTTMHGPPSAASIPVHTAARESRSIMLLLCATDPLGLIAAGYAPERYASTAASVLEKLAVGGGVDELFGLFLTAGNRLEAVDAFTRAAVAWGEANRRTISI